MFKNTFSKRTIIIISIIPLLLIYFFKNKGGSLGFGENIFTVRDINKLSKISIYENNEGIILLNTDKGWIIENGGEIDKSRLMMLEKAVELTSIKAPVPKKEVERIESELKYYSTEVMMFKGKRRIKHFNIVYDSILQGDFMRLYKKNFVFNVHIPGYAFNPSTVYKTSKSFWQNNSLLSVGASDINKIRIDYFENPSESFSIIKEKNFVVEPDSSESFEADNFYANAFFNLFISIDYSKEKISEDYKIEEKPYINIFIETNSEDKKLEIHRLKNNEGFNPFNAKVINEKNDTFIVKYIEIDPFLKSPDYFKGEKND